MYFKIHEGECVFVQATWQKITYLFTNRSYIYLCIEYHRITVRHSCVINNRHQVMLGVIISIYMNHLNNILILYRLFYIFSELITYMYSYIICPICIVIII